MTTLRSLVFTLCFYAVSTVAALAMVPLLLTPRTWITHPMRWWARVVVFLVRFICGVGVEFRGLEHLPDGAALIAAKHQCMFDTIAPLLVLADPAYVMRDSLLRIPFYGWYSVKAGMIPIDREGHARALRAMLAAAKARAAEGRRIVIFPEGTRTAPGAAGDYKPGVAALYRSLGVACVPLATNSGIHWPAHGFVRRPGLVVYEFLEPLPAGLARTEFMALLEARLEAASAALLPL
ncbi:MAG TPA: lysophospholipid acyltransferase family protein [Caulobacteraceae bacterium]|jgi:1-acyl-sn-glycerol-3-phosphate acyltransferase|nr:lysophospholipid acyltransferase family protein [Caulobacteraceae bacterium]